MDEYIDRDAFLEQQRAWYCKDCNRRKNSKGKTVYEIGEAPCRACDIGTMLDAVEDYPAADVRSVVLCRDCKWCHAGYCEKYDDLIPFGCANKPWEDWFCADGKKKEES